MNCSHYSRELFILAVAATLLLIKEYRLHMPSIISNAHLYLSCLLSGGFMVQDICPWQRQRQRRLNLIKVEASFSLLQAHLPGTKMKRKIPTVSLHGKETICLISRFSHLNGTTQTGVHFIMLVVTPIPATGQAAFGIGIDARIYHPFCPSCWIRSCLYIDNWNYESHM